MTLELIRGVEGPMNVDFLNPETGEHWNRAGDPSSVAAMLLNNDMDLGILRPYKRDDLKGGSYYTKLTGYNVRRNQQGLPIINKAGSVAMDPKYRVQQMTRNDATLRILDWIQLDEAIIRAAKPRLRAAKDLEQAGLVYNLPNGIAKTIMQFQTQSDISGATVSIDGLRQSESDRPVFGTVNFPLPLIHKDFSYPLRQVLESRTGYSPLDVTTAELAGRRVAEQIEQFVLGCGALTPVTSPNNNLAALLQGITSYTYGGGSIYGYMNFPSRLTYTIVQPTTAGWVPQTTVDDVLAMKTLLQQALHYGPWMMYVGLYWDRYMDNDYKPTYNDMTLRQRLREIDGIIDVRTVDYIPDDSILLVQQTTDVVRLVKGMDITTIQWESHGGMQLNFKVLALTLPQLRTDYYSNTGIMHGS